MYVVGSNPKTLLKVDPQGRLSGDTNLPASGVLTAPNGKVMVSAGQSLVRLSPNGYHTILALPPNDPYHGVHIFYPGGIAIAPNNTIYIDTSAGNGWADKSAIVAISPSGTSTLLWEQNPPATQR